MPSSNWWEMSLDSARAARAAEAAGCWRSSVSRYYYAAYQATTAVLLHLGLVPPAGRQGWSHADTPEVIRDHLRPIVRSSHHRNDLASRLLKLYRTRVAADYVGSDPITSTTVEAARKDAGRIIKVAPSILPHGDR
jgi:uncharacterized protein (UPF0332 family)